MALMKMPTYAGGGGAQVEAGNVSLNYSSYTYANVGFTPQYVGFIYVHPSTGMIYGEYVNGTCYLTYNYGGLNRRDTNVGNFITVNGSQIGFKGDNSSWGTGTAYFIASSSANGFEDFLT